MLPVIRVYDGSQHTDIQHDAALKIQDPFDPLLSLLTT